MRWGGGGGHCEVYGLLLRYACLYCGKGHKAGSCPNGGVRCVPAAGWRDARMCGEVLPAAAMHSKPPLSAPRRCERHTVLLTAWFDFLAVLPTSRPPCRAVSWPDGPCSFLPEHELHGLTRLRRCYFDRLGFEAYNLPGGPWLASLRFLAANTWSLIDTVRVLEGATALTRLTLVDWPDNDIDSGPPGNAQIADFYEWAQAHPQLRRLTFVNSNSNAVDGEVFRGALALKAARPELQIDACPGGCDPALADFFYSGLDDLAPGWSTSIALTEPYQY